MSDPSTYRAYIVGHIQKTAGGKGLTLGDIDPQANLLELGVLDSLGFVQMILAVEAEFGLEMDLGDLDPADFTTLEGLVGTICRCAQAA